MYFEIMEKYSVYKIPYCMDSFTKNEIASETSEVLFSAIESHFLPLKNQVFFSIVKDNLQYLKDEEKYHIIQIEEHLLTRDNYDLLHSQII